VGTGWLSDLFTSRQAEGAALTAEHKAIGLHQAMYVVPALDVLLVLVLVAASLTVKHDYLRLRQRMRAALPSDEGIQASPGVTGVTDRPK
jgi:hypothetical protein